MMKKSRLGRNLDMLLSGQPFEDLVQTAKPHKEELRHLPIEWLQAGRYQPRREFAKEALEDLANSIRTQGIINPIVVRLIGDNRYEIIAGERRWRAAQLAKLNEVPVLIKVISDETALAISLIENIQRQDLNPLEEAEGIQRLINEFKLTHQEIATTLGRSRTTITNLLRLLSLAPQVKLLLQQGQLEMGHARALLSLSSNLQIQAAEKIVKNKLSVREAERLVQNGTFINAEIVIPLKIDADVQQLERKLSETLGAKVYFKQNAKGKGQLIIHYNSLEELDGILSHMN
ncbi:chromosome partitioning protein ParB [Candidatus Rickettsiella isopodorum]|jgi:ParB family chromosome partitioning protein|uniref:Probable chromosome-partitioning protein ParB n=1 Tax=Candidatus Rickettsiella isopodorum TaxID=1225476 RepID=A0A1J8P733_9COXI|nr:ParB/RepB/Spo0J family partition protein [Candidatus Rickettsiella isopodorum]OIZ95588.1 chromosome partitioning protein ParB [Candidatus Rickettsiella isopodorum]